MSDGEKRWQRLEEVVQSALERPSDERPAFLAEACGGDEELRREAASLVARDARAEGFLATPLGEIAANAMTYSPGGTPQSDETRNLIGSRIGAYEIRARIGAGGMGEVYRAHDHSLHRDVAIKVLPATFSADGERLARFEREARLLASLSHPHIGAIYGLEGSGQLRALVLELIDGETLEARLQRGRLPGAQVLTLAVQIAEALDHAHRRGVTHRDLKPANVMLTKSGAKLLDFGLAKWSQRPSGYAGLSGGGAPIKPSGVHSLTSEGTILGTLHYMAPEQLEGKGVDARADVFAFGAVLYEMLTGRKAFDGGSAAAVMASVLNTDPPPLDAGHPLTPRPLDRIIRKCLAKDPDHRWQTTRDLADELKWIADEAGQPSSSGLDGGVRRSGLNRWATMGAVALALALAGLAGWSLAPSRESSALQAITSFTVRASAATQINGFDISPDGSMLVYAGGPQGFSRLFIRRLDQFVDSPIPGTEGAAAPFFSPDGRWVGYFDDGRLLKMNVNGAGAPVVICRTRSAGVLGSTWLVDGSIIFTEVDHGLQRVSAEGGEPVPVTTLSKTPPEIDHHTPSLLPGGHALLYTQHQAFGRFNIVVETVPSAERKVLVEGAYDARYVPSGHLVFVKDRTIAAVPFDVTRLEVTGPPVTLVENVTANPDEAPATTIGYGEFRVSVNGTLLFQPDPPPEERTLTWVDRNGVTTPLPLPVRAYGSPRISPDASRIAFAIHDGVRRDLWTYELATEKSTRLTREGDNRTPLWTLDGQRLVFSSMRDNAWQLFWMPADGSGDPERLVSGGVLLVPGTWSADGQTLLYVNGNDRPPGGQIFSLPLGGERKPELLLDRQGQERQPSVSPDGRWVAFTSEETGRNEIYVAAFPSGGGRRQVSVEGGRVARWRRDGRELVYRSRERMFAVPIDTSRGLSTGKPRVIFEGRYIVGNVDVMGLDYDLAPDGRFLMLKASAGEPEPPELRVILNWVEELTRRVPKGR